MSYLRLIIVRSRSKLDHSNFEFKKKLITNSWKINVQKYHLMLDCIYLAEFDSVCRRERIKHEDKKTMNNINILILE